MGYPRMEYPSFMQTIGDERIERIIHVGDAIDKPGNMTNGGGFSTSPGAGEDPSSCTGQPRRKRRRSLRTYLALFPEPYRSFSDGDTLFLLLCTELPGEESTIGGNSLRGSRRTTTTFRYKFVFLHEPLFPVVPFHGLDGAPA